MFKNIDGITKVETEEEFLEKIKDEEYYKIFKQYEESLENIPIEELEVKLDRFYFENIFNLAKKINKNLEYIIGTEIDLLNIIWIYRSKKYFRYSNEEVRKIIIPINYKLTKNQLNNLLEAEDFEEMITTLKNTIYKNVFSEENDIEHDKDKFLYDINLKIFRTKMFDICTIFCNINLVDIEIKNIINIIEGIRYKLDKTELQKKIII